MTLKKSPNRFSAPFALFIGPQRAGTSWLYRYFNYRDDICLPKQVKELFYFDFNFENGPDYYFSHFKEEPHHELVMEVSATYFMHPEAPKRIHEYFGRNLKLICPLRHPVSRSYSLYKHFLRYGLTEGTLQEACKKKPEILISSHYVTHLKNWAKYYNLDDIYFCFQEDLDLNQETFVRNLCDYLEVPFFNIPENAQNYLNVSTKPPVQFIANIAQIAASELRSIGFYWVINIAKAIGLKKLIFGKDTKSYKNNKMSKEEKTFLEEKLSTQVNLLEDFLGYKIEVWHQKT